MSLIRKHGAVLQAWACLDLVHLRIRYKGRLLFCAFEKGIVKVNMLLSIRCKTSLYQHSTRLSLVLFIFTFHFILHSVEKRLANKFNKMTLKYKKIVKWAKIAQLFTNCTKS